MKDSGEEKLAFLKEFAKCGIYHNYGYDNSILDFKLQMMNEAVKELASLHEQLTNEQDANALLNNAIEEACKQLAKKEEENRELRNKVIDEVIEKLDPSYKDYLWYKHLRLEIESFKL